MGGHASSARGMSSCAAAERSRLSLTCRPHSARASCGDRLCLLVAPTTMLSLPCSQGTMFSLQYTVKVSLVSTIQLLQAQCNHAHLLKLAIACCQCSPALPDMLDLEGWAQLPHPAQRVTRQGPSQSQVTALHLMYSPDKGHIAAGHLQSHIGTLVSHPSTLAQNPVRASRNSATLGPLKRALSSAMLCL